MNTTLILGASETPSRFSYRAFHKLVDNGHQVIAVNPKGGKLGDMEFLTSLEQVDSPVDTATIYVNPSRIGALVNDLIELKPRRVIFNPGSESETARKALQQAGIETVEACTLIMLDTGHY